MTALFCHCFMDSYGNVKFTHQRKYVMYGRCHTQALASEYISYGQKGTELKETCTKIYVG